MISEQTLTIAELEAKIAESQTKVDAIGGELDDLDDEIAKMILRGHDASGMLQQQRLLRDSHEAAQRVVQLLQGQMPVARANEALGQYRQRVERVMLLQQQRDELRAKCEPLRAKLKPLESELEAVEREYFDWLNHLTAVKAEWARQHNIPLEQFEAIRSEMLSEAVDA